MAENLLLIEDEKLLAAEIERRYVRLGWQVRVAKDLATARWLLEEVRVDPLVVVVDMLLPDGSSLDLLEALNAKQAPPR